MTSFHIESTGWIRSYAIEWQTKKVALEKAGTDQGVKMTSPNNSYNISDMVAIRDPFLEGRPESKSAGQEDGVLKPNRRPIPHREFAVQNFGKRNENDSESAEKHVLKCCFPCFPFRKQRTNQHLDYSFEVFEYTELQSVANNFDKRSKFRGSREYGFYKGTLYDDRKVAVIKLEEQYSNNSVERFMNEVQTLTNLRHSNLLTLYGCTDPRESPAVRMLVFEYIPNRTLEDHLHGRVESRLNSWPVRLSIAIEIADALVYLHRCNVVHGDVDTDNVILDSNFRVKVAYFGLSRFLLPDKVSQWSSDVNGTWGYRDPEYYKSSQFTKKSDVYSFGVVLVQLISSLGAMHKHDDGLTWFLSDFAESKIKNFKLHELVGASLGFEADDNVRRMITSVAELALMCLQDKGHKRPSMEKALERLKRIQVPDSVDLCCWKRT